jgi:glutaminyl-peptide cyclotransferase
MNIKPCGIPLLSLLILPAAFMAAFCLSCEREIIKPRFDGGRAFDFLEAQVALGPRNPGSRGWQAFQRLLSAHLDSLDIEYLTQPFDYYDYMTGDTLHLVNWIARINPEIGNRILIAAHYDCRPRAEYDPDTGRQEEPIPGANDGASGAAVLMHLAELMVSAQPRIGVDLIFFDGEDYGPPGRIDQYLLGSSYFASHHEQEYRFAILLDMIGDSNLTIYRERISEQRAKEINDKIWETAARFGIAAFIDSVKHTVIDDHLSLMAAGIPTVDVIDFDYPHWHTHADTPDKCSPASLEAVGQVMVEVIYDE